MLNVLKSLQLKKTSGRFHAPLSTDVLQHIDANWYDAGDPNALRASDRSGNGNYALLADGVPPSQPDLALWGDGDFIEITESVAINRGRVLENDIIKVEGGYNLNSIEVPAELDGDYIVIDGAVLFGEREEEYAPMSVDEKYLMTGDEVLCLA